MKNRRIPDAILNLIGAALTFCAVVPYFMGKADALGSVGTQCLRYFTTDSNMLAAVACAVVFFFYIRGKELPRWALLLKFTGTTAVTVTLVTVVIFLGPTASLRSGWKGYLSMFEGNILILHLLMPLLSLFTLLWAERERITFRESLWAMLPTALYACVYLAQVVIFKNWPDFYGFTFGGKGFMIPVSFTSMLLLTLGLSSLLRKGMNRKTRQRAFFPA